jgi:glutaredoxin-related protein
MIKELKRKEKFHLQTSMAIKRRRQRLDTKKIVLEGYSKGKPKCVCCGFSNLDGLALDHIEGRKKMGHSREFGSDDLRMWAKREYNKNGKWPLGIQVLCHNCNGAKRESAVCPHQLKKA